MSTTRNHSCNGYRILDKLDFDRKRVNSYRIYQSAKRGATKYHNFHITKLILTESRAYNTGNQRCEKSDMEPARRNARRIRRTNKEEIMAR